METNETIPTPEGGENKTVTTPGVTTNNHAQPVEKDDVFGRLQVLGHGDKITTPKTENKPDEQSSLNNEKTEAKAEEKTVEAKSDPVEPVVGGEKPAVDDKNDDDDDGAIDLSYKEIVERLDEAVKEYGFETYREAQEYVSIDFTNHDVENGGIAETDTIAQAMILEDPGTTDSEIDAVLLEFSPLFLTKEERDAAIADGKFTREDVIKLDAKFSKLLRESENKLISDQEKIDLDGIGLKLKINQTQNQNKGEITPEQQEAVKQEVLTALKDANDTFKIVDKDGKEIASVPYTFEEADVSKAAEAAMQSFKRWMNPDGTVNWNLLGREMNYLVNREKIHSIIYQQALSSGAEKQVKDINNINFDRTTPHTSEGGKKSLSEAMGLL